MSIDVLSPAVDPAVQKSPETEGWARFAFAVLTPVEAARFLEIPTETLIAEAEAGRVPGRKLGGEWRFLRLGLIEWLKQPTYGNKAEATSKERLLALAGAWKDDPTVDAMIAEIYRDRKRHPVGGE